MRGTHGHGRGGNAAGALARCLANIVVKQLAFAALLLERVLEESAEFGDIALGGGVRGHHLQQVPRLKFPDLLVQQHDWLRAQEALGIEGGIGVGVIHSRRILGETRSPEQGPPKGYNGGLMSVERSKPPQQCPDTLNRDALLLSFRLLRPTQPALALRIRNCQQVETLSHRTVHEAVAALSRLSKHRTSPANSEELVLIRQLLLTWMEFEVGRLKESQAR